MYFRKNKTFTDPYNKKGNIKEFEEDNLDSKDMAELMPVKIKP